MSDEKPDLKILKFEKPEEPPPVPPLTFNDFMETVRSGRHSKLIVLGFDEEGARLYHSFGATIFELIGMIEMVKTKVLTHE